MKKIRSLSDSVIGFIKFKILNFLLPNLGKRSSALLIYRQIPTCQQYTKVTGRGVVEIGAHCVFGYKLGGFYRNGTIEFQARFPNARIQIGNNVATNNNIFICAAKLIEIGDDALIGQNVTIMDFEAHAIEPTQRRTLGEIGTVKLGKNIWIGNNVTILKNTEIGDNAIIAAGAVVRGKFPANVIIGGVPAKVIRDIAAASYADNNC